MAAEIFREASSGAAPFYDLRRLGSNIPYTAVAAAAGGVLINRASSRRALIIWDLLLSRCCWRDESAGENTLAVCVCERERRESSVNCVLRLHYYAREISRCMRERERSYAGVLFASQPKCPGNHTSIWTPATPNWLI
jgi:hypothetical protein